jgi:hypothetical protein
MWTKIWWNPSIKFVPNPDSKALVLEQICKCAQEINCTILGSLLGLFSEYALPLLQLHLLDLEEDLAECWVGQALGMEAANDNLSEGIDEEISSLGQG